VDLKPNTLLEFSIVCIDTSSVKICIQKIDKEKLKIQHQTLSETCIEYDGKQYQFSTSKLGDYQILNVPKFCVIYPGGVRKFLFQRPSAPTGSSEEIFEL
jgi:hypothetical protein